MARDDGRGGGACCDNRSQSQERCGKDGASCSGRKRWPCRVGGAQADLADATAKAASDTANAMTGSGVSTNACPIVKLLVPDGIGVVITPSQTVLINKWGACRVGDMIQEVTSVNAIAQGLPTVIIGG